MTGRLAIALCPHCGRYPRLVHDRAGVDVLDAHDWRRGVPCVGSGLPWGALLRAAGVGVPMTVAGGAP